jgi:hypothetical protein
MIANATVPKQLKKERRCRAEVDHPSRRSRHRLRPPKKETVPDLVSQAARLRKATNDALGEQETVSVPDDVE